jgi:EAL domain-containing protein (putative c-di-GMP-specific phosphodiesterase class I)
MNEQELLQRADVAMYFAKRKNFGYAIYDKSEDKHDIRQLGFEVELRDAIENDDLTLHYQPKIDVKNKQVASAEVLLRWNHAEHGYIPAEEISLLAEKTGLITPLSKWVVKNAIEQLATWITKGIELPISINLSVWNLQDPDFFDYVDNVLKETAVPAAMITFEITESAVMSDPESAIKTLQQLSNIGANLSIDDYGTGFSSLQYLKIMPINEIKIDKSFVTDMVDYDNDAVIVRSIIDLSHNLGMTVVAEGVETQDVFDILEILSCDVIQGYHISRPIPSQKLEQWLSMRKNDSIVSKNSNITYLYN